MGNSTHFAGVPYIEEKMTLKFHSIAKINETSQWST